MLIILLILTLKNKISDAIYNIRVDSARDRKIRLHTRNVVYNKLRLTHEVHRVQQ
jgi:hypothetical protein